MKKIEQKIIKFIDDKNLLKKNDKLLIALSGGADSVFLLHLLNKYKKRFGIEIAAFHLNHKLRGKNSDQDEEFCRKLCNKLNIDFYYSRKNVKSFALKLKQSIEQAGRELRYKELKKIVNKYHFTKVATAHNCDDNAETVLLNLIKGAGVKGMSGIPVTRGIIIRPMLSITKNEVINYLQQSKIEYRTDLSNFDTDYERNFLRHNIIPIIKQRLNPALEETLLNSADIFKNIGKIVDYKLEEVEKHSIKFSGNELEILIDELKNLQKEFYGDFLKKIIIRSFSINITYNDIKQILSLIKNETGTQVNLTGNLNAVRERKTIVVFKNSYLEKFVPVKIKQNEKIKFNGKEFLVIPVDRQSVVYSENKWQEYISADNIKSGFILRRWETGDRFYPLGLKGSKKVSDYLTDQKIAFMEREKQLVLTTGGKIVWVIGLRLDDRFRVSKNTKKVLKICVK